MTWRKGKVGLRSVATAGIMVNVFERFDWLVYLNGLISLCIQAIALAHVFERFVWLVLSIDLIGSCLRAT